MKADFNLDQALSTTNTYQAALNGEVRSGSSPNEKKKLVTYTAKELAVMQFEEPKWIIKDLITEGLTILGGAPKVGKSWLVLAIALAVASGGVALDKIPVEGGEVLYFALEDIPRRLKGRIALLLAGEDAAPERLFLCHSVPKLGNGLVEVVSEWLHDHPTARLVVIDTLARVRKPKGRGADVYGEDAAVGAELQKLALSHHVAVVVVHHLRKQEDPDPMAMISGSFGLVGSADTGMVLRRGRNSNDAVLSVTGRDIEERDLALSFKEGVWSLLGDQAEVRRSEERQSLIHVLTKPPALSPKDVARITGKNYGAVKKLLWQMAKEGDLSVLEGKYTVSSNIVVVGNPGNPGNPVTGPPVTDGYRDGSPQVTQKSQPAQALIRKVTRVTVSEQKHLPEAPSAESAEVFE